MKQQKNLFKKNKPGFVLMEVLLTVTLMATVLTSIFALEGSLFRAIFQKHSFLERVFVLRNLFFDYEKLDELKQEPTTGSIIEEQLADPKTDITLQASDISSSQYPFLYKLEAKAKWQGLFMPYEEVIMGLIFAHVPEDKKVEPESKVEK